MKVYDKKGKLLTEPTEIEVVGFDNLMNEEIVLLRKVLIEIRQSKLHLASISDENINEKDAEG